MSSLGGSTAAPEPACPHLRTLPPKPVLRPDRVSLLSCFRRFREDILSAQPARLYRAWMAEFRTPFFTSFLCNDPELVDLALNRRPEDFPKSARLADGMAPLLGHAIFITNGAQWAHQRRIIDPAFASGRRREMLPLVWDAAVAGVARMADMADGSPVDIESQVRRIALDVIFRTLFSTPVEGDTAAAVEGRETARKAYVPFSAGQRVCPGSAFTMIEVPLILAMILRNYHLTPAPTAGRCRWRN